MESAMFVRASVVAPFWKSSSVCRLKDEKVVKPPSRPIIRKFRVKSPARIPAQTPMANEPAMFTNSVPQNAAPALSLTIPPSQKRKTLPSAPPSATWRNAMAFIACKERRNARGGQTFPC